MLSRGVQARKFRGLIGVILALLTSSLAFGSTLPTDWYTGGGTLGFGNSGDIMFEIAQPGNGIALDAGSTSVKLSFSSTGPHIVRIFDGPCNVAGDYDHAPGGSCNGAGGQVKYSFYYLDSGETVRGAPTPQVVPAVDGSSLPTNNWGDVPINLSTQYSEQSTLSGDFTVLMVADFTGIQGGRLNGFKVQTDEGTVSYRSPGLQLAADGQSINYQTSLAYRGDIIPNGPYAVGNSKTFNSQEDKINFSFQTPCLQDTEQFAYLRWTDADGKPSTSPQNWQISFDLWESIAGAPETKMATVNSDNYIPNHDTTPPTNSAGAVTTNIGGQAEYRQMAFKARPNSNYRWEWTGVQGNNGIQMWAPFDTVKGHCENTPAFKKPGAQCVSISTTPNNPAPGTTFNATVVMKNTGTQPWNAAGNNPFRLGAAIPRDNFNWSPLNGATSNRVGLSGDIAPNANATFNFTATVPASPTTTTFAWAMVQEGKQWFDGAGQVCSKNFTFPTPPVLHKIFAGNLIDIPVSVVRDNFRFAIDLFAYFWPDAGLRSRAADRTARLWLAGIWGKDSNDNAQSDNSINADPNIISKINTLAETGCGDTQNNCLQRVPLAYVPQNDGAGVAGTATKDGSTTPNGNNWLSILQRIFGSWDSKLGGIASNLNENVGGATGNVINNVEISNVRVEAVGIGTSATDNSGGPAGGYGQAYQGKVNSSILQADSTTQGLNLPGGSQGPQGNKWDNIRNPQGGSSVYSTNIFNPTQDYANTSGSPANFSDNPETTTVSLINTMVGRGRQYGTVNATSLLQDGQGTYTAQTEPLTYTATVTKVDNARLKWDEYVDWTQVDDKGHWYTDKAVRPTGVYTGNGTQSGYSLESFDQGSQQVDFVHQHTHQECTTKNGVTTCITVVDDPSHTHYTQCTGNYTYRTGIDYEYNGLNYYYPSVESRFGWYNTSTTTQPIQNGGNGSTSQSAFYAGPTGNPSWSNTGSTAYWQDTSITPMTNSASTNKPAHLQRWIYNTTDPLYNNRRVYNNSTTPSFITGWHYTYSSSCKYPNGGGAYVSSNGTTTTYYPSPGQLYEGTGAGPGTIYGTYGDGATYDGSSDGNVDVGWSWAGNKQRVRYEQTYTGHYRNLGPRDIFSSDDNLLFGFGPTSNQNGAKPARGMTTIGNPTISISDGDVFTGGGLNSYFQGSQSSAFVFSNKSISNFSTPRSYLNYFINRDRERVNASTLPGGDSVRYVFKNYDSELVPKSVGYPGGNNVSLGGKIYRIVGNYTMAATTFCSGAGTIIVEGNLTITGNLDYCAGTDRSNLPSVGFIVTGNVKVDAGVDFIKGAYFINGSFSTGSVTLDSSGQPNNNRTSSDRPFALQGLIVANDFSLQRQQAGGGMGETFTYDGRVVISTPPGFANLYNVPAVWNEGAPSN